MRQLAEIEADLAALGRPRVNPFVAVAKSEWAKWQSELTEWRQAHPGGDEAYVALLAEIDALEAAQASERAIREATRAFGAKYLPKRVAQALEIGLRDVEALVTARKWLEQPKPWLVLMGTTGTGKSSAAGWALRRCHEQGATVAWADADTLAVQAGGFGGEALNQRLRTVDVLVLDDLGTEHRSRFCDSVVLGLLKRRHEECLRTIVTTNLTGAAFRSALGERLADRIKAECVAKWFDGESLRTSQTQGETR